MVLSLSKKDSLRYIAEKNTSTSEQENAASLIDIISKLITIKQICGWTKIG
jgi:DNA-directed RNA polymerase subunit F